MKTVSILTDNTNHSLTHTQWADYLKELDYAIAQDSRSLLFFGTPPVFSPKHNAAWLINIDSDHIPSLQRRLETVKAKYERVTVIWIEGVISLL